MNPLYNAVVPCNQIGDNRYKKPIAGETQTKIVTVNALKGVLLCRRETIIILDVHVYNKNLSCLGY